MNTNPRNLLAQYLPTASRVLLAPMFLIAGYGKLTGITGTVGYMQAYGMPFAELLVWPAALAELGAGVLLLVGWEARWAALALAAFTVIVTPIFHAYWTLPDPAHV